MIVFFTLLSSLVFGSGSLCRDPLYYGELRSVKTPSRCLGTRDNFLVIAECKGWTDQFHMFCGDGTIRNDRSKYCLQAVRQKTLFKTRTRLQYRPCVVYPEIPNDIRWAVHTHGEFTDEFNITQSKLSFVSLKDGNCMAVTSKSKKYGTPTWTYRCSSSDYMFFYFRSKGRLLQSGYLRNQANSTKCIEVEGGQIDGNVGTDTCAVTTNQRWRYYESGELVSEANRCCMNPERSDGYRNRNLRAGACDYGGDQRWDTPHQYSDGNFSGWRNQLSNNCMDVEGTDGIGNMRTYTCDLRTDQRFEWVKEDWTPPNAVWTPVRCNENGAISLSVQNSVSYSHSLTVAVTVTVGANIAGNFQFGSVGASASVATAVSNTWTNTHSESMATTVSCDYYSTGEPFTGGCMWQTQMTTEDVNKNRLLWLSSSMIRCTKGLKTPVCPPFTRCYDDECQHCEGTEADDKLYGETDEEADDETRDEL